VASNLRLQVLKKRSDFLFILKNGQRVRPSDWILFNFVLSESGEMRCGWTLPRQVGSAVIRNKLKRWSRIYFRNVLAQGHGLPIDVNVVFRKAEPDFYKKLNYEQFSRILDKGWQQVRGRVENPPSSSGRHVQGRRSDSPRGSMPV
jgi:ribonuclease P protein component